jgi:HSP20 family protein
MAARIPFMWPAGDSGQSPFAGRERSAEERERLWQEMSRLFANLSSTSGQEPRAGGFPLINVTQDRDHLYIRAELPGITADALSITATDNNLAIAGQRTLPIEEATASYHRREREAGSFSRTISLPTEIAVEKASARYSEGILTIVVPKAEMAKPKQIKIQLS